MPTGGGNVSERDYTVAIVGATGVVGGTVRAILEERDFPVGELRLLASERSRGAQLAFNMLSRLGRTGTGVMAGLECGCVAKPPSIWPAAFPTRRW